MTCNCSTNPIILPGACYAPRSLKNVVRFYIWRLANVGVNFPTNYGGYSHACPTCGDLFFPYDSETGEYRPICSCCEMINVS